MKKVMMPIRAEGTRQTRGQVDRLLGSEGVRQAQCRLQQIRGRVDEFNGGRDGVRVAQVDAGAKAIYKNDIDHLTGFFLFKLRASGDFWSTRVGVTTTVDNLISLLSYHAMASLESFHLDSIRPCRSVPLRRGSRLGSTSYQGRPWHA